MGTECNRHVLFAEAMTVGVPVKKLGEHEVRIQVTVCRALYSLSSNGERTTSVVMLVI